MNDEIKSIHEFDLNLIGEYFSLVKRQGPGSPEVTKKALSFIDGMTNESVIADLGCGTGGQTMVMAQNAPGKVTGLDVFPIFINLFNENTRELDLQDRVKGVVGSMDALPFQKGELDLIWSEGAIYNIGFERGLREWREFLKPGGYVAVTEATWFTEERPKEIKDFWELEYPDIDTVSHKIDQMQKVGYVPVAAFILPENCWTEHFFDPQVPAQEAFLEKYAGNEMAIDFIKNMRYEAELYSKYKEYYGYAFYIGRKY
jgi:SAM-dependent methyltransferase